MTHSNLIQFGKSTTYIIQCTAVCPVNEYVGGSPETCQPCPAMSTSPGGVVRVCPCMDGYARFNESYPLLPCGGEYYTCSLTVVKWG